jgi:hypothetical protein
MIDDLHAPGRYVAEMERTNVREICEKRAKEKKSTDQFHELV